MEIRADQRMRDLLRRSLARVEELQAELADLRAGGERVREPVAVIGIGCRMPGAALGPAAYLGLLARGGDAVGPAIDRSSSGRRAGWLGPVDGFDTEFMAIAPREAARL